MGMVIAMQKEIELNESQVEAFYRDHVDQPYFPQLVKQMTWFVAHHLICDSILHL